MVGLAVPVPVVVVLMPEVSVPEVVVPELVVEVSVPEVSVPVVLVPEVVVEVSVPEVVVPEVVVEVSVSVVLVPEVVLVVEVLVPVGVVPSPGISSVSISNDALEPPVVRAWLHRAVPLSFKVTCQPSPATLRRTLTLT